MPRHYHYFLCSLPGLPDLGGTPPVDPSRFRQWTLEEPALAPIVDAVLLEQDLLWREAALAGGDGVIAPFVLTPEQASGRDPIPPHLRAQEDTARRFPADATWEAYFRHAAAVGASHRCPFVSRFAAYETALRNALARERARALGFDPADCMVAEDLAASLPPDLDDEPPESLARAWIGASDPLSGLRALDEARLDWARRHSMHFSFRADEAAAYARQLVLLHRWREIGRSDGSADANAP